MSYEIDIFIAGTRPASNGMMTSISPADLQEVADTYDPEKFRAPAIITHSTGEYSDRSVTQSELCHGFPDKIRRVGDRLKAVFNKISPNLANWIRQGALHSVSPSFYLPGSPNNPYPGKYSLRHIAFLGATPPACKGMPPLPEPPTSWEEFTPYEFNFNESEEGVINFGMPMMLSSPWSIVADLFQRYREFLIESEDLETADRVLPADQIAALRDRAASDADKNQQIYDLQMRVAQLESDEESEDSDMDYIEGMDWKGACKKKGMSPKDAASAADMDEAEFQDIYDGKKQPTAMQEKKLKKVLMDTADMSEQEAALQAKEQELNDKLAAIAKREAEFEQREVSSFCESLVKQGKLLAAKKADTITLLLNTPNANPINFSEETGEKTPRQALMDMLNDQPSWNYGEAIAPSEFDPVNPNAPRPNATPGATSESIKQDQAIRGQCQRLGKNPDDVRDYAEVATALGYTF